MKVGIAFYEQGNYPAAIAEFEEAYKAKPKASPLVNMALCYKAQFAYPKAIRALQTALDKHSDTMDDNDKKAAQTEIDEMRARLSYVTFKLSPAGSSVQIDNEAYPDAAGAKPVPLSPGPHTIKVSASGYASVEQPVVLASGARDLEFTLKPNMGFVHIKADGPRYAIAVDQTALGYGEWSGLLGPGPHIVEMYIPGSPAQPYRARLDVEVGQSYEMSPGKGGVPLLGNTVATPPNPPAPRIPAKPITGPFVLATVSLFGPTEHPAAFTGQGMTAGVAAGVRAGYRVNTPVSFDAMVEYANVLEKKRPSLDDVSYTLQELRAGVNMRLQTPGKVARFYGSFGGGFVYEWLEFSYAKSGLSGCLQAFSPPRTPSCANVNGPDGFFMLEAGLQFSFGSVLVDAAFGTVVQSVRGFGSGTYGDWLPMLEGGLRVGYAAW